MQMHSPGHPGDMVGNMIEELEIAVTNAARHLGVTRQTLNNQDHLGTQSNQIGKETL